MALGSLQDEFAAYTVAAFAGEWLVIDCLDLCRHALHVKIGDACLGSRSPLAAQIIIVEQAPECLRERVDVA